MQLLAMENIYNLLYDNKYFMVSATPCYSMKHHSRPICNQPVVGSNPIAISNKYNALHDSFKSLFCVEPILGDTIGNTSLFGSNSSRHTR